MIYSTAIVPVNPDGETKLTREQAWAGLELKARDAREFLPPGLCTRCEVVEDSATHLAEHERDRSSVQIILTSADGEKAFVPACEYDASVIAEYCRTQA